MPLFRKRKPDLDALRDTLYGDAPLEDWPPGGEPHGELPWTDFVAAREELAAGRLDDAKRRWRHVATSPELESRHHLQAWHFLRAHGEEPPAERAKDVLGVVVEMALPEGLDLLAAYRDGGVRYYNHAGGGVVVIEAEGDLAELVDALLAAAADVVAQIGPWTEPRPGPPPRDHARLSFLTPSGLHFGEGTVDALAADPLGGAVLAAATAVMAELVVTAA